MSKISINVEKLKKVLAISLGIAFAGNVAGCAKQINTETDSKNEDTSYSISSTIEEDSVEQKGVKISVVDITNRESIPGAFLRIRNAKGETVYEWCSKIEPSYFELEPGRYTLEETEAPMGYNLQTETVTFDVHLNEKHLDVKLKNEPELENTSSHVMGR